MSYTNWTEKTHDYLSNEQWARLDDLMYIFAYLRTAQLKYRSHRAEGLRLMRSICKSYTIERNARFPAFNLVNMTKGLVYENFMELLKAIDVAEFDSESQELVTALIKRFFASVTTPSFNILVIYGVFSQYTFEKYHQLEWVGPDSD